MLKTAKKVEKEKLSLNFKPLNVISSSRKGKSKLDLDIEDL